MHMKRAADKPILVCKTQTAWKLWLTKNHTDTIGVRLQFFKKVTGKQTFTYAEALDTALCFGWIDGQSHPYDSESWLQNFTQRRVRSPWSKRNIEHTKRLIADGKMQPPGLAEIDRAQKDGRWDLAYDAASTSTIPEDFLKELHKYKKATAFFESLNKANVYAITYRLQTAKKPETRERRMKVMVEMMKKGESFH
jgi:uncharacterized protein YdeI (YjbR/CyaY-like superfamily)